MIGDLNIAVVCMNSPLGEIEKNLEKMETFVQEAETRGADLICFPELSITGYRLENPAHIYDGFRPEKVLERVEEMARRHGLVLLAGMVEPSDGSKPYISQVVAGPDGLLGVYRKTHLSPNERATYRAGRKIEVFSLKGTHFGVQLCYESHFPEISTVMALKGAEILFIPHASPRGTPAEKAESWLRHLPGRAFDNGLYVVAYNQVGNNSNGFLFPGVAVALNPSGRVMNCYRGYEEKMMMVHLAKGELEETRKHRMKYFLPNRRPELYSEINRSHDEP
jgi:N-carbamoylputrescine amidase